MVKNIQEFIPYNRLKNGFNNVNLIVSFKYEKKQEKQEKKKMNTVGRYVTKYNSIKLIFVVNHLIIKLINLIRDTIQNDYVS